MSYSYKIAFLESRRIWRYLCVKLVWEQWKWKQESAALDLKAVNAMLPVNSVESGLDK